MAPPFLADLQAGLTLTLVSVPTSVAYASLAGLPGIRGLTTPASSLIAFGLMSRVKWLASGATSITAVTVKADLEEFATATKGDGDADAEAYVRLVCMYALLVGGCSIALAVLKMGQVAKAIPKSVMSGFKWGAACVILSSQASDCVLGSKSQELGPVLASSTHVWPVLQQLPAFLGGLKGLGKVFILFASPFTAWRPATAALSATTVWFLKGGAASVVPSKCTLPQGSEVLLVCALATLISVISSYSVTHGAASVIGPNVTPPTATTENEDDGLLSSMMMFASSLLPQMCWSQLPWEMVGPKLIVKALIFSAVNFSATVAICATFEQENGLDWDANHELLTQGVANVVAGLTGCQPVGGSLTRSLVTRLTNAYSSRAACINGLCMLLMLPVLWVIEETPRCVLAAVVLSQVVGTIFDDKHTLRKLTGPDRFLGFATAAATAATSPTYGILIGCALALAVSLVASGKNKPTKGKSV